MDIKNFRFHCRNTARQFLYGEKVVTMILPSYICFIKRAVWTLHWVVQTGHSFHSLPARIMLLLEWLLGGAVSAYSY